MVNPKDLPVPAPQPAVNAVKGMKIEDLLRGGLGILAAIAAVLALVFGLGHVTGSSDDIKGGSSVNVENSKDHGKKLSSDIEKKIDELKDKADKDLSGKTEETTTPTYVLGDPLIQEDVDPLLDGLPPRDLDTLIKDLDQERAAVAEVCGANDEHAGNPLCKAVKDAFAQTQAEYNRAVAEKGSLEAGK